jgi:type VI secretion system protein ImpK
MSEPSPDAMYWATADVLAAAAQIGDARIATPSDTLRQQMLALLGQLVTRCRQAGIADAEIAEARYAIVAFIDERVMKSNWPGRAEWQSNPLQLQLYREFTAGENFFGRMRALIHRGSPVLGLEAYYLCVALGFTGALPGATGAPAASRSYLDAARAPLLRGSNADRIAPNAIPAERHRPRPRPFPVAAAAVVACTFLCVLALVGVHFALDRVIGHTADDLAAAGPAAASLPRR